MRLSQPEPDRSYSSSEDEDFFDAAEEQSTVFGSGASSIVDLAPPSEIPRLIGCCPSPTPAGGLGTRGSGRHPVGPRRQAQLQRLPTWWPTSSKTLKIPWIPLEGSCVAGHTFSVIVGPKKEFLYCMIVVVESQNSQVVLSLLKYNEFYPGGRPRASQMSQIQPQIPSAQQPGTLSDVS